MKRLIHSSARGAGLIEVMATMAVMTFGILALGLTVSQTATQTRRNLSATQAQMVAERVLEGIVQEGCTGTIESGPCTNLIAREAPRDFWVSAAGEVAEVQSTAPGLNQRRYHVSVDVDPPYENPAVAHGSPPVDRQLVPGAPPGNVVNVRVSVTWQEPGRPTQAVALQTRVSPYRENAK